MENTTTVHRYNDRSAFAWNRFILAMHSGETVEIDEAMWNYWLGVLPPVMVAGVLFMKGDGLVNVEFGFAEGDERIVGFWRSSFTGKLYCRQSAWTPSDLAINVEQFPENHTA